MVGGEHENKTVGKHTLSKALKNWTPIGFRTNNTEKNKYFLNYVINLVLNPKVILFKRPAFLA